MIVMTTNNNVHSRCIIQNWDIAENHKIVVEKIAYDEMLLDEIVGYQPKCNVKLTHLKTKPIVL